MIFKLGWLSALLLAGLLTAFPGYSDPDPKFDKVYKKAVDTKTWVVYEATGGHMSVGDKFRVKKSKDGKKIKLVPLFALREKWGKKNDSTFSIELMEQDSSLCGLIEIGTDDHEEKTYGHGPKHAFSVKLKPNDTLKITWSAQPLGTPDLTDNALDKLCKELDTQNHGGIAHAQPN